MISRDKDQLVPGIASHVPPLPLVLGLRSSEIDSSGSDPRLYLELLENVLEMFLDGSDADAKFYGDLTVCGSP